MPTFSGLLFTNPLQKALSTNLLFPEFLSTGNSAICQFKWAQCLYFNTHTQTHAHTFIFFLKYNCVLYNILTVLTAFYCEISHISLGLFVYIFASSGQGIHNFLLDFPLQYLLFFFNFKLLIDLKFNFFQCCGMVFNFQFFRWLMPFSKLTILSPLI